MQTICYIPCTQQSIIQKYMLLAILKLLGLRKHALWLLLSSSCVHSLHSYHQCPVTLYSTTVKSLLLGFLCLPSTSWQNLNPFQPKHAKIFMRIIFKIPPSQSPSSSHSYSQLSSMVPHFLEIKGNILKLCFRDYIHPLPLFQVWLPQHVQSTTPT